MQLLLALALLSAGPPWSLPQAKLSAPEGHATEARPRPPQSFAIGADGVLRVADTFAQRILSTDGTEIRTAAGAPLAFPSDIALDSNDRALIADRVRFQLIEPDRAYGRKGEVGTGLLEVGRVEWGPSGVTAVADTLSRKLVLFRDGKPLRAVPCENYGHAFDPAGTLVMPRFATLTGFVLSRERTDGTTLPAQPFDLASPLSIDLLSVAADGTALAVVPVPHVTDGRQELLRIEPGGRAHPLWSGQTLDATRTFAVAPDGRIFRASLEAGVYTVQQVPDPPPATAPPAGPTVSHEVLRYPSKSLGRPVGLVQLAGATWLIGADGRHVHTSASGPVAGSIEVPALAGALAGPSGTLWLREAQHPVIHVVDSRGAPAKPITLAGWPRAPDLVTASADGQILAHDRLAGVWRKHDATGAELLHFDQVGAGALDVRSELLTIPDTDEPYGKALVEFDSNGNFFKSLTTFKESTRPTGARFLGNTPDGDLLIGYWLGPRARVRRITQEGSPRGLLDIDLAPGATTAVAEWAVGSHGEILIATREGGEIVVRAHSPP